GEPAIRVDHELDRRLSAGATHPAGFPDQVVLHEALGDIGDGRRREPRDVGQVSARDRTVDPYRMQGHPLIVVARTLQVRTRKGHAGLAALFRGAVTFVSVHHITINYIYFLYS